MAFEDKSKNEYDGLEEKGTFIEKIDKNILDAIKL